MELDTIVCGDCLDVMADMPDGCVDLIFWSGPYLLGKSYERHLSFEDWLYLYSNSISHASRILKSGCFLVINCADILAFPDETLPRIRSCVLSRQLPIAVGDILPLKEKGLNKYQIAEILGCSEQTIDRRLNGNNARGRKMERQTRIELTAHHFDKMARQVGLYLYDRRIWVKDPAWENCQWHSMSYRSVDEFEYLLIFAKPGSIKVDRRKLADSEWGDWASRGVWYIPSVRRNDIHEAMFPTELALRVIRLFSNQDELVADFFIGSGTTAVAALKLGRRFYGCDINPEYVKLANERIEKARLEMSQLRMAV